MSADVDYIMRALRLNESDKSDNIPEESKEEFDRDYESNDADNESSKV